MHVRDRLIFIDKLRLPFQQRWISLLLVLLMLPCGWVFADPTSGAQHFRFSGFGTLGAVQGGNDILAYRRSLDQKGVFDGDVSWSTDSRIGVQLDVKVDHQWGGAVQLVGRDRSEDSFDNTLEWAFIRYNINPDWTVRLGRVGLDVYSLSDYRSLGFSYLWVRPPQEFYSLLSFSGFDGGDITWTNPLLNGSFRLKVFAGHTSNNLFFGNRDVDLKFDPLMGVAAIWENDQWELRGALVRVELDSSYDGYFPGTEEIAAYLNAVDVSVWPQAMQYGADFKVDDPRVLYASLGATYNHGFWRFQSEVSYADSKLSIYPGFHAGYISVGRQVGAFTPYILLASTQTNDDEQVFEKPLLAPDPNFPAPVNAQLMQLQLLYYGLVNMFELAQVNQSSGSLGMRWDMRYDMALKMQWDRTLVEANGAAGLWNTRSVPQKDTYLSTYTINFNYIF